YPVTLKDIFHFKFENLFISEESTVNPMHALMRVLFYTSFNKLFHFVQRFCHFDLLNLWQFSCRNMSGKRLIISLTSRDMNHIRGVPRIDPGGLPLAKTTC